MHAAQGLPGPDDLAGEIASLLERYRASKDNSDDPRGRLDLQVTLIRLHNDRLRRFWVGGRILMTRGVSARSEIFPQQALLAVSSFTDFSADNDPHGEHDFGALDVDGERVFFKIDAYDKELHMGSPDAAEPTLTERVLTIMLAEEY